MKFRGDYYFLSSMFPCSVRYFDLTFKCSESLFQAFQCTNMEDILAISKMNGFDAKKYSKTMSKRSDWKEIRLKVMTFVVDLKFHQNIILLQKLARITEPIVEENTWGDTFWGVCNGIGYNYLGRILEKLKHKILRERELLRDKRGNNNE